MICIMKIIQRRLNGNMKIGRNQPCPCGSGKKYKKCCLNKPREDNKKTKNPEINKKLLNIYDNRKN